MEQELAFKVLQIALWMIEYDQEIIISTSAFIVFLVGYFTCYAHERIEERLFPR